MSAGPPIALVTARVAAATDVDLPPLLEALAGAGLAPEAVCWDDPDVDWSRFRLAVLRSPWDYVPRHAEFLEWLARVERRTTVLNQPDVVRWSTDKRYLRDLATRGVPVVPTTFHEPDAALPELEHLVTPPTDGDVVVKPVVSAGSRDTIRHSSRDAALAHAHELLTARRAVMVQPYLAAVDDAGETGLVYFDGVFSHVFRKGPILGRDAPATAAFFAEESITRREPSRTELSVAESTLAASPPDLLYARVDLVPDACGAPVVLELELAEPSYFVAVAPESAARFAVCVAERLG